MSIRTCSLPECERKHYGHGFCNKHYQRWRSTGSPDEVRISRRQFPDAAIRLATRSERRGECLIYTAGHSSRSGHVMMIYEGRQQGVHRIAWIVTNGPVPVGMVVRHKCDVPRCVDPAHLELGTIAENNRDRADRKRSVILSGASNPMAKLSESIVQKIREQLGLGHAQRAIAREFGVSQRTVWNIAHGHTYADVPTLARHTVDSLPPAVAAWATQVGAA